MPTEPLFSALEKLRARHRDVPLVPVSTRNAIDGYLVLRAVIDSLHRPQSSSASRFTAGERADASWSRRALQGNSFCRLYDALSQLFAERSVSCEHLTAEIPIEQLIFGIQIAKSGCKLIKFSASSSIQFNKCRASRHCQNDRENHDKRCAVLRHELSFRVRSEVAEGFFEQFSLIYSNPLPPPASLQARSGS
jgi:hypothetical protein